LRIDHWKQNTQHDIVNALNSQRAKREKIMDRIVIDKKIMHGKPVIKGTRVPVEIIVGSLAGGMSYEEIEKEYGVAREDILLCCREPRSYGPLRSRNR
jgi:uncharacterized protein (DUF433 family)